MYKQLVRKSCPWLLFSLSLALIFFFDFYTRFSILSLRFLSTKTSSGRALMLRPARNWFSIRNISVFRPYELIRRTFSKWTRNVRRSNPFSIEFITRKPRKPRSTWRLPGPVSVHDFGTIRYEFAISNRLVKNRKYIRYTTDDARTGIAVAWGFSFLLGRTELVP